MSILEQAQKKVDEFNNNELSVLSVDDWPAITPLETSLPPVEPFNYKLLPVGLWEPISTGSFRPFLD